MNVDVDMHFTAVLAETEGDALAGVAVSTGLLPAGWTAGGVLPGDHAVAVRVE